MQEVSSDMPLSVSLLKKMGFLIPKRPLCQTPHLIIYNTINRKVVRKIGGLIPMIRKCPPIAISVINNKEVFMVYTPFPKTITKVQELLEYIH